MRNHKCPHFLARESRDGFWDLQVGQPDLLEIFCVYMDTLVEVSDEEGASSRATIGERARRPYELYPTERQ